MTSSVHLVTGAAGFIGSHLARALLARGDRVVGVDAFDPFYARSLKEANLAGLDPARFELVEADIRDRGVMADLLARVRPRVTFHLAALAGVRPSIREPDRYASVNVEGLLAVLDAARAAATPARVVFASSSSVYGNGSTVPFAETDPAAEPISPYAATKRAGELLCHAYAHLFGCAIVALRFFTAYGPAQRPDLAIATFMRAIGRGEEIEMYGDGTSSRDYTYIDDVVAGVLAAADRIEREAGGVFRIYNLGGSKPVSLGDLIAAVAGVVGRPARVRSRPMQPGDVERTWADLARSRAELGYAPVTTLREGLARQWAWLERGNDGGSDGATKRRSDEGE